MLSLRAAVMRACAVNAEAASLQARDLLQFLQALPGQARHQCVELLPCQRQRLARIDLAWPHEAPGVQPPRRTPHAEAVVHEQLDRTGPRVGKW